MLGANAALLDKGVDMQASAHEAVKPGTCHAKSKRQRHD